MMAVKAQIILRTEYEIERYYKAPVAGVASSDAKQSQPK